MAHSKSAFSLVELMVTVAIIGGLAALSIPRYGAFMAQARRGEAKANVAHIAMLQSLYKADHWQYYSGSAMPADGHLPGKGIGHGGDCSDPADNSDRGLNNHLGFAPLDCNELRYKYFLRESGQKVYAYASSDTDGKYVYPNCKGASTATDCGLGQGDVVTLSINIGKPEVCRNIIKYCPDKVDTPAPADPVQPDPSPGGGGGDGGGGDDDGGDDDGGGGSGSGDDDDDGGSTPPVCSCSCSRDWAIGTIPEQTDSSKYVCWQGTTAVDRTDTKDCQTVPSGCVGGTPCTSTTKSKVTRVSGVTVRGTKPLDDAAPISTYSCGCAGSDPRTACEPDDDQQTCTPVPNVTCCIGDQAIPVTTCTGGATWQTSTCQCIGGSTPPPDDPTPTPTPTPPPIDDPPTCTPQRGGQAVPITTCSGDAEWDSDVCQCVANTQACAASETVCCIGSQEHKITDCSEGASWDTETCSCKADEDDLPETKCTSGEYAGKTVQEAGHECAKTQGAVFKPKDCTCTRPGGGTPVDNERKCSEDEPSRTIKQASDECDGHKGNYKGDCGEEGKNAFKFYTETCTCVHPTCKYKGCVFQGITNIIGYRGGGDNSYKELEKCYGKSGNTNQTFDELMTKVQNTNDSVAMRELLDPESYSTSGECTELDIGRILDSIKSEIEKESRTNSNCDSSKHNEDENVAYEYTETPP